jgi:1,4-alpha-glucan branching enzyme
MGGEFGQSPEWNANGQLEWWLLEAGPFHKGLQAFVADLNRLYQAEPALWQSDYDHDGFNWLDCSDHENSVLSFVRQNLDRTSKIVVIMNLTPVPRFGYRLGLPVAGNYEEVLNSDAGIYGGGNVGNLGGLSTQPIAKHGHPQSAEFTLPPLSVIAFKPQQEKTADLPAPRT